MASKTVYEVEQKCVALCIRQETMLTHTFILVLRPLILTSDHNISGHMSDADCGVGGVDGLPTRTSGLVCIDF